LTAGAVTLLLIDDEPAVATALERWLRDVPDIAWIGCAPNLRSGLDLNAALKPRIVLLDLDMVLDRLSDSVEEMVLVNPAARVVMFTGHAALRLIDESLLAGAAGFITKETEPSKMLELIRAAGAGDIVLCPSSMEIMRKQPPGFGTVTSP
jgi:DNA-binding NarL/FixJ family response regulator